jgi:hypothetical protein
VSAKEVDDGIYAKLKRKLLLNNQQQLFKTEFKDNVVVAVMPNKKCSWRVP